MSKIAGFVLMIHATFSLVRYRKHLIFNDQADQFTIPLDVRSC